MQIPALQSVTVEILVDNLIDMFEPSRPGSVERVAPGRLPSPCWRPTAFPVSLP